MYIAIISKILFIFHFYPSILTIIFFKIEKEWFVQLDEAVRIYFVLSWTVGKNSHVFILKSLVRLSNNYQQHFFFGKRIFPCIFYVECCSKWFMSSTKLNLYIFFCFIDISNCSVWHVKGKLNGRSRLLSIKEYKVECNIHHGSQIVWIFYIIYR